MAYLQRLAKASGICRSIISSSRPNILSRVVHTQRSDNNKNGAQRYGNVQKNPFLLSGPRQSLHCVKVDDCLFMRIDMPGIAPEEVKVWVEDNTIYFKGYGSENTSGGDSGLDDGVRNYGGNLSLREDFKLELRKFEMDNGVLRITVVAK